MAVQPTGFVRTWACRTGLYLTGAYLSVKVAQWLYKYFLRPMPWSSNLGDASLAGKVVVVTGASSGLGEAFVRYFHSKGCRVIACARSVDVLRQLCESLTAERAPSSLHPQPLYRYLDLMEYDSMDSFAEDLASIYGGQIDILVNNAGVSVRGSVSQMKMSVFIRTMGVNFFGPVALTRALLPHLQRNCGAVVAVSTVQGKFSIPFRSAYSASKHAFQAFFDALRAEAAAENYCTDFNNEDTALDMKSAGKLDKIPRGLRVLLVNPGYIRTNLSKNALTGSGAAYDQQDAATERGMDPQKVAERVGQLLVGMWREEEVTLAPAHMQLVIYLRNIFPRLYFRVMEYRAKKGCKN